MVVGQQFRRLVNAPPVAANTRVQFAILGTYQALVIHAAAFEYFLAIRAVRDGVNPTFLESRPEICITDAEGVAKNRGDHARRKSIAESCRDKRAAHYVGAGF